MNQNSFNSLTSTVSDIQNMMRQGHRNAEERISKNKHFVFDLLDSKGVKSVSVQFDGSGDSGSVESIDLQLTKRNYGEKNYEPSQKEKADLLNTMISGVKILECTMFSSEGWQEKISEKPATLQEGIESIAYDALKATHEGWENNDGAYGTVTFDAESRSVTMEYYERSTEYSEHEF